MLNDIENMIELTYSHTYSLSGGECDATSHMPATLLTERIIEVATEHADSLGLGFADLQPRGLAWVLSRVTIEMASWPKVGDTYTITTWVEDFNRLVSERVFEITATDGSVYGRVRSTWAAIDIERRVAGDLSAFDVEQFIARNKDKLPVDRQRKMLPVDHAQATLHSYTFKWCDLDFNRHVNTVRYVEHILNMLPREAYETAMIQRFEIAFAAECLYGDTVEILCSGYPGDDVHIDIVRDGRRMVSARILFKPHSF